MANPTGLTGLFGHRVAEALDDDDIRFKFAKAYFCKEDDEIKDDIAQVTDKIEVIISVTKVNSFEYAIIVQKELDSAIDYNRCYITNDAGKTLLCVDFELVEGATDIHNSFIYKIVNDCGTIEV